MTLYQKIPGPFIRSQDTHKLTNEYSSPELRTLADSSFIWTEKVDGTNIRIIWDGYRVTFGGRTDNAQIPAHLVNYLAEKFGGEENEQLFEQTFGEKPVTIFGEGYGPKIQKGGGNYREDVSFVVFDVIIDGMYLLRDDVENISHYFKVDVVPIVITGTMDKAIALVRSGLKSRWGDFWAEGLVGVTPIGLLNRRGQRIITKVKHVDFYNDGK